MSTHKSTEPRKIKFVMSPSITLLISGPPLSVSPQLLTGHRLEFQSKRALSLNLPLLECLISERGGWESVPVNV